MKRGKKYIISTYNFSLACVFLTLVMIGEGLVVYFALTLPKESGIMNAFYFCTACFLLLLTALLHNGYEYFGVMEILSDRLEFRAPMRKTIVFCFEEIADIGIDYGVISGMRHFYIFIGKSKISPDFTHRITRLRFSDETMRIQYRRIIFDTLLEVLPQETLGKKLSKNESVIRLFHLDDK